MRIWMVALLAAGCGGAGAPTIGEVASLDEAKVELVQAPHGSADAVVGRHGAARGFARAFVYAGSEEPIADGHVATDGSFGPLQIGDNLYGSVWLQLETATGIRGPAYLLENDVVAPAASLSTTPPATTGERTATFELACDEAPCTFECGLDGGVYQPCESPYTVPALDHGSHIVRVRATDAAGNTGVGVFFDWKVELPPPTVSIDEGPPSPSPTTEATVRFSSTTPGATFECNENGELWRACQSPHHYFAYEGPVVFEVRAVLHGRRSEPASYEWTVDFRGPSIELLEGPALTSNDPDPLFRFACSEEVCEFTCVVDDGEPFSCESPLQLHGLGEGEHHIEIRAQDALGNEGLTIRYWDIDLTPAEAEWLETPPAATGSQAGFAFACVEQGICTLECNLDEAGFATCESPLLLESLADGSHELQIRARDWVGNAGTPLVHAFVVDTTAPTVRLDAKPEESTASTTARFEFSCVDEPCTFTCTLDETDPVPCISPWELTDLPPSTHDVRIEAVDRVGLAGATTWRWTVTGL